MMRGYCEHLDIPCRGDSSYCHLTKKCTDPHHSMNFECIAYTPVQPFVLSDRSVLALLQFCCDTLRFKNGYDKESPVIVALEQLIKQTPKEAVLP